MNATMKDGIAVLVVALLLFNPLGRCASMSTGTVSHPCCPAPGQNHCAKPGCFCGSTAPRPVAVPSTGNDGQTIAAPASEDVHPNDLLLRPVTAFASLLLASNHRFVTLHQFLI
jgi:hypothetical protein